MADHVRHIPEATVARLPVYLRSLAELVDAKITTVSSERLAEMAGVNAAKVRKDLSYLGSYGTRGVGYDVEYLLFQMSRELGLTRDWPVVIVGAGNLGQALANYGGFTQRGFPVAALVDADAAKVGQLIHGVEVRHVDDLPQLTREMGISIGIIATPAAAAQAVADVLVAAGVRSVLNFAPAVITVPPGCRSARSIWRSSCRSSPSTSSTPIPGSRPPQGADAMSSSGRYPVSIDLRGAECLVVGGGRVAARKVRGLLDAGARVTVLAPELGPALSSMFGGDGDASDPSGGSVESPVAVGPGANWIEREFTPQAVHQRWSFVVAATDDPTVNDQVVAEARRHRIWANNATAPTGGPVALPAVARLGPVTVAVSTGGVSPGAAAWLRDLLAEAVPAEVVEALSLVAEEIDEEIDEAYSGGPGGQVGEMFGVRVGGNCSVRECWWRSAKAVRP